MGIGDPIADSGDNLSAGPLMRLILRYEPENYIALYHAGMAEFALEQHEIAKKHLSRFVEIYKNQDGFRSTALSTLERLQSMGIP